MALRLRNRLFGSGSSSIGSVEGSRVRGIHADSVFVSHYSPRMNSIKLLPQLTPSRLPCWNPHPFFSLYLFSLSLKTAFNRWTTGQSRLKPGQWLEWEQTQLYFQKPKLVTKSWTFVDIGFHTTQATQGSNALFLPNMPKYSIAVSLWSGQCCCSSSVTMSCVSLWQARWLSPAKVIVLLRRKYSTSHTKNRQRLLFSSQKTWLRRWFMFWKQMHVTISSPYKQQQLYWKYIAKVNLRTKR